MSNPIHDQSIRKRVDKKQEKYPSPDSMKRAVDRMIYFFSVLIPIMTLPQVIKIWILKDASGVSILTWSVYFIAAIAWLFYGIVHKEKPIILLNMLLIILNGLIVVGTFLYG